MPRINISTKIILADKDKALIISTIESSGEVQMDLDLYFLDQTINSEDINFTLRFYTWKENCLSIGFHQKLMPKHWLNLADQGLIKIIKRPSGGGAVLHSGGITYALTFKKPLYKKMSYQIVNNWLIASFSRMGLVLKQGHIKKSLIQDNCFGSKFTSDLIDQDGYKRIGSAQYWKKGSFLQHGEILLNPPSELWLKVFRDEAPPKLKLTMNREEIINKLRDYFIESYSESSVEYLLIPCDDIQKIIQKN